MPKLTGAILFSIDKALTDYEPSMAPPTTEVIHATKYIQYLLKQYKDKPEELEASLVRFFRIRPKAYLDTKSPITTIHKLLEIVNILPKTNLSSEEKLLSEFVSALFTPASPNRKNGHYHAVPTIDLNEETGNLIYKTICNVEVGIRNLTCDVSLFDWNKIFNRLTNYTRLHDAVANNDTRLISLLLAAGADANAKDNLNQTPFDKALSSRDWNLILLFINSDSIELSGSTQKALRETFYSLFGRKNEPLIKQFFSSTKIKREEYINGFDDRNIPLVMSVYAGSAEMVKLLIDFGADVNKADSSGLTPLIHAAKEAQPNIVEVLLQHGANPHLVDDYNNTALSYSNVSGHQQHLPAYDLTYKLLHSAMKQPAVNKKPQSDPSDPPADANRIAMLEAQVRHLMLALNAAHQEISFLKGQLGTQSSVSKPVRMYEDPVVIQAEEEDKYSNNPKETDGRLVLQ